ncbi:tetratricopeptide repeat protein [Pseudoxanthomonas suwonensis]|uniref:Glycosyltransferase RgtA/B/C/D-like domain-containing protein n=1 Tax=Pseudoxanthomonas suwonensis TaxID=314722 RepID=A0A0E3UN22_9GAMM|nr:hypothetical protein [Pseudoxanthomonas suwonensis]AKC86550.1 hypothetical protein WQ53_06980 [Pseudoxanthomonas suwonensis]
MTPPSGTRPACLPGVLLLLGLVVLAVLRSHHGTRLDSFTVDEPWHIVAGVSYVRTGDYRLNPEHPPLVKLAAGAAMPAGFVLRPPAPLHEKLQERDMVEETMFYDNDAARAQQRARVAMWLLNGSLLLALGLVLWRALGLAWAAGALAFLAIEPTVAAHLPVVMTDLPLALTLAIAAACAGLLAAGWRWRWVAGLGVALGLALSAKHSALAGIGGILAVLGVAVPWGWRSEGLRGVVLRLAKLAVALLLAIVVLWALYGFRFHAGTNGSDGFNRELPDKLAEIQSDHWREGIAFADRWQLLPRSYLWGLADTVRTGVEGRSISEHFVWGRMYEGHPPWFSWPAIIAAKVPLALLLLSVLGAFALWRLPLAPAARWTLWAVLGSSAFHLVALVGSGAIWGGVRHAMPVLVAMAVLAGAAVQYAWQRRPRAWRVPAVALLAVALAMTVREPRVWEYHNELVGGSGGAYRYFDNEGLDLGQRFAEIREFHDRVIRPSGQPMYLNLWMIEEQMRAAGLNNRRRVEDLRDDNVQGVYEGYFVHSRSHRLPWPSRDWDPAEGFAGLHRVASFGNTDIWQGRQLMPRARAHGMQSKAIDYIYKERGEDWRLVALRLEEVVALFPQSVASGIELGNAYVRLGDGPDAIRAYRRFLDQDKAPVDAGVRRQVEAQIAGIRAAGDQVAAVGPMRNPTLE